MTRSQTFIDLVEVIFAKEGGYVNNPRDNGGMTNMGITYKTLAAWRGVKRSQITEADMRALTKDEATDIYHARYWLSCRCDDLPSGLDMLMFDYAVNSGPRAAGKALQHVVKTKVDGIIGGMTLRATWRFDPVDVIRAITRRRVEILRGHEDWDRFGNGWMNRFYSIERRAIAMCREGRK